MRAVFLCSTQVSFDNAYFKQELKRYLTYLAGDKKPRIILSTGFWHHRGDEAICEYAAEEGLELVKLGDLGERDDTKALGLFWHEGVANHPGDLGMKEIADRLFAQFKTAY